MRTSILAALLLVTIPAFAQEDRADAAFREGVEALRQGAHADAERLFRESYGLRPRAATACNLALTYEQWGEHQREALEAYETCARDDQSGRFQSHALSRADALREAVTAGEQVEPPPTPHSPFVTGDDSVDVGDPPPGRTIEVHVTTGDPDPQQSQVPVTEHGDRPAPSPGRRHPLLWTGLVALVVSGGLVAGGAAVASSGRDDVAALDEMYPDETEEPIVLDPNTDAAQLYDDADRKRTIALALYVGAGAVGVLGAVLMLLDVAQGSLESPTYGATPVEGGAMLTARLPLR